MVVPLAAGRVRGSFEITVPASLPDPETGQPETECDVRDTEVERLRP